MLNVHNTDHVLVVEATGTLDDIGSDLLMVCNSVLNSIEDKNPAEAMVLRIWLFNNLKLGMKEVNLE